MKKDILLHVVLIILTLSIVSCGNSRVIDSPAYPVENSDKNSGKNAEDDLSSAYPGFRLETSTSDLRGQEDNSPSNMPMDSMIPEPKPDSAIIYGTLMSTKTNQPLPNIQLLLANMIPVNPGSGFIVSTSDNSPNAFTNDRGAFLFLDINPGNYVLILKTPFNSYPIVDKNNEQIKISLASGNLLALGTTYVNWP